MTTPIHEICTRLPWPEDAICAVQGRSGMIGYCAGLPVYDESKGGWDGDFVDAHHSNVVSFTYKTDIITRIEWEFSQ